MMLLCTTGIIKSIFEIILPIVRLPLYEYIQNNKSTDRKRDA